MNPIHLIKNIKQRINDWFKQRNEDLKKWKEEDPDSYYEYLSGLHDKKY